MFISKLFPQRTLVGCLSLLCVLSLCSCTASNSTSPLGSLQEEDSATPQMFEVNLSAENIALDGKPIFAITTNLPDDTELLLTLKNNAGYTGQDKVIIADGKGQSGAFSSKGNSLSGEYTLKVTMGMPSIQKDSVQKVIGSSGEYMTGDLVEKGALAETSYNTVHAEFSFTVGSANYQQALQKIAEGQYDEAKTLLEKLPSEGYLLSANLLKNMNKLKALLENEWVYSDYGWSYYSTFDIAVSQETITLYNYESEYSGSQYLGDYKDVIDLEDLLDDGEADVYCELRDNFTLDINNVLNGEITQYNEWVNSVYKIVQ